MSIKIPIASKGKTMPKIELSRLKKIIQEEMMMLSEGSDHDAASKQMNSATKLLSALETFKETASEKSKAEFGSIMDDFSKILSRIIASPMQYVDAAAPPKTKKVSLKPQKTSDTL